MSDNEPELDEEAREARRQARRAKRRAERSKRTFNPISPVVLVIVGIMAVIELGLQAGAHGWIGGVDAISWRNVMAQNFGLNPAVVEHILQGGTIEPKVIWPFFTYIFVARSFINFLIVAALILAMGKMIADRFSSIAVLILFISCTLVGAIVFGLSPHSNRFPMLGAYPVFYGFIGTYTWIGVADLRKAGKSILPAFAAVGMFLVFRGTMALVYGPSNSWTADLAGLLVGFGLAYLVAPDGKDRIKRWLRRLRNR